MITTCGRQFDYSIVCGGFGYQNFCTKEKREKMAGSLTIQLSVAI